MKTNFIDKQNQHEIHKTFTPGLAALVSPCDAPKFYGQHLSFPTDLSKGVPLGSHNSIQYGKPDNCIKGSRSNVMPVMFFMVAQLLLGAGGSPLFTLGTTYIDDHVKRESSSMYIGEPL